MEIRMMKSLLKNWPVFLISAVILAVIIYTARAKEVEEEAYRDKQYRHYQDDVKRKYADKVAYGR